MNEAFYGIEVLIGIAIALMFILLLISTILILMKNSKKDWNTLEELKKKANQVSTKEEIEEFHKEFLEKANKVSHNEYINIELQRIDGYLRGLYKQFKT